MGLTSVMKVHCCLVNAETSFTMCGGVCHHWSDPFVTSGGKCMCLAVDLNLSFVAEVWMSGSNGWTCTNHDL